MKTKIVLSDVLKLSYDESYQFIGSVWNKLDISGKKYCLRIYLTKYIMLVYDYNLENKFLVMNFIKSNYINKPVLWATNTFYQTKKSMLNLANLVFGCITFEVDPSLIDVKNAVTSHKPFNVQAKKLIQDVKIMKMMEQFTSLLESKVNLNENGEIDNKSIEQLTSIVENVSQENKKEVLEVNNV